MTFELYEGDCLKWMAKMEPRNVDAIIADLPYGTTACEWDSVIPLEQLWQQFKRVIKPGGAVVLFGAEPFSSVLQVVNLDWFKYRWVWEKTLPGDVFNAKNKPMRIHEDILVFSSGTTANGSDRKMTYNPQGLIYQPTVYKNHYRTTGTGTFKNKRPSHPAQYLTEYTNYPTSILKFQNGLCRYHPTQKPVDLLAYLIRTYTNAGDLVLDCTMGSGTTGVAAIQEGRCFVGMEKEPEYFAIAHRRIQDAARAAQGQPKQLTGHAADWEHSPLFAEVPA